jgi:hypothetical protein
MRFCDLFISYKIGLKSIESNISFTKLPCYRKVYLLILEFCVIVSCILLIFHQIWLAFILAILGFISLIIFLIIDSKQKNLKIMLKKYYIPYSEKRMSMTIDILSKYKINIHDIKAINRLIKEAKKAQIRSDYFAPLKKPLKTLCAIVGPIVIFASKRIGESLTPDEMVVMAGQIIVYELLVFSLVFSITPIVKKVLYRDYNIYEEFMYDLRQIKIFYLKSKSVNN